MISTLEKSHRTSTVMCLSSILHTVFYLDLPSTDCGCHPLQLHSTLDLQKVAEILLEIQPTLFHTITYNPLEQIPAKAKGKHDYSFRNHKQMYTVSQNKRQ